MSYRFVYIYLPQCFFELFEIPIASRLKENGLVTFKYVFEHRLLMRTIRGQRIKKLNKQSSACYFILIISQLFWTVVVVLKTRADASTNRTNIASVSIPAFFTDPRCLSKTLTQHILAVSTKPLYTNISSLRSLIAGMTKIPFSSRNSSLEAEKHTFWSLNDVIWYDFQGPPNGGIVNSCMNM